MPIAESIDVEDVNVGGHNEHVLWERSEHMPGVQIKERSHEVEPKGGCQGNQNDPRRLRGEKCFKEFIQAIFGVDVFLRVSREGPHDQVYGEYDQV